MSGAFDPLEQFTAKLAELQERLADLERAARRSGGELRGLDADLPPAGRFDGQQYWATDTDRLRRWDGTDWIVMHEPRQTWTPTLLSASNPQPAFGSTGGVTGWYQRVGGLCKWKAVYTFNGTGISAGTGAWSITLPKTGLGSGFENIGHGWMYNGTFHTVEVDFNGATNAARMVYEGSTGLSATAPGSVAAGTVLSLRGEYPMNTAYL